MTMVLALKHEKEKSLHSIVKEARAFVREIPSDIETKFDAKIKNTKNAQKFKIIAEEKGKKGIHIAWK